MRGLRPRNATLLWSILSCSYSCFECCMHTAAETACGQGSPHEAIVQWVNKWATPSACALLQHKVRLSVIISPNVQRANKLVEQLGMPLELDTDGIWCALPGSFPENFKASSCLVRPPAG